MTSNDNLPPLKSTGSTLTMVSELSMPSDWYDNDLKKTNSGTFSPNFISEDNDLKTRTKTNMVSAWFRTQCRHTFTKKMLYKRLPILEWLPKYNMEYAISDAIAGFTVGLTAIPQGIAYSAVAHLPAQYGLYSAFMGCFAYIFFGSVKDVTVGPTAIMALMTGEHAYGEGRGPDYAVFLAFLSGLIITSLGIFKIGFVIDFISSPVIAGFTSAAAITIASNQVKNILALEIPKATKSHIEGVIGVWADVVNHIDSWRWSDTVLGIFCMVFLISLRALKNVTWFDDDNGRFRTENATVNKYLRKVLWVLSIGRNAFIVIFCTAFAYGVDPDYDAEFPRNGTFILAGSVESGLPSFHVPPFETNITTPEHPEGITVDAFHMIADLGSAIVIIPLISILESIAIAKAFAGGKSVDANQEMIALGLCNVFGSFVRAMPVTGSFSRTAINANSGVKTTMGGLYTGILVLLCLVFLMPLTSFIPKTTLGAVIIAAVIFMIEYEVVKPLWRSKKSDLLPGFTTFFVCLFWALEYGILIGVVVNVFMVLYNTARPQVRVDVKQLRGRGTEYIVVTPDRGLVFPSVAYVRNIINKAGLRQGSSRLPLVLDCTHIHGTDYTAAKGFKSMIKDFRKRNQPIIFYNPPAPVAQTYNGLDMGDLIMISNAPDLQKHLEGLLIPDGVIATTEGENLSENLMA